MAASMENIKHAAITGAGSGIGAEFARRCATEGYHLLLIDKNRQAIADLKKELESTFAITVDDRTVDLTNRTEVNELCAAVSAMRRLDLLINNAGIGETRSFANTDLDFLIATLELNCAAVLALCKAALDGMLARQSGTIINVASVSGLVPSIVGANYGATKGFLINLSRSLNRQVRHQGVYVQALCPGWVRTNIEMSIAEKHIPKFFFMPVAKVVDASWRAMRSRKEVCVPGMRHRILLWTARYRMLKPVSKMLRKIEKALRIR